MITAYLFVPLRDAGYQNTLSGMKQDSNHKISSEYIRTVAYLCNNEAIWTKVVKKVPEEA